MGFLLLRCEAHWKYPFDAALPVGEVMRGDYALIFAENFSGSGGEFCGADLAGLFLGI